MTTRYRQRRADIFSSHSLRGIKRGLSGVLTVGSSLRQPSSLPNISPPLPFLSRLVHRGIQVEGQGKRGLLSHVYVLVPAVASIMVNYTQHTPSKTDTQQVLELPGCFDSFRLVVISVFKLFKSSPKSPQSMVNQKPNFNYQLLNCCISDCVIHFNYLYLT